MSSLQVVRDRGQGEDRRTWHAVYRGPTGEEILVTAPKRNANITLNELVGGCLPGGNRTLRQIAKDRDFQCISGCGKSVTVAACARHVIFRHFPRDHGVRECVFDRFTGATAPETEWHIMAKSVVTRLVAREIQGSLGGQISWDLERRLEVPFLDGERIPDGTIYKGGRPVIAVECQRSNPTSSDYLSQKELAYQSVGVALLTVLPWNWLKSTGSGSSGRYEFRNSENPVVKDLARLSGEFVFFDDNTCSVFIPACTSRIYEHEGRMLPRGSFEIWPEPKNSFEENFAISEQSSKRPPWPGFKWFAVEKIPLNNFDSKQRKSPWFVWHGGEFPSLKTAIGEAWFQHGKGFARDLEEACRKWHQQRVRQVEAQLDQMPTVLGRMIEEMFVNKKWH